MFYAIYYNGNIIYSSIIMLSEQKIKEVIVNQRKIFLDTKGAFWRQILDADYFEKAVFKTKEVVVITGVRRCGKSYLLRLLWQKIKTKQGLDNNQFLYLNFEDERLVKLTSTDLANVLEAFFELYSPKKSAKIYLFFDEIQEVEHWEKFINRLREDRRFKIFITGSNASLLSSEIATQLVGRNITAQLSPLSFFEFLKIKMKSFSEKDVFDTERKGQIKSSFNQYLKNGGFPEVAATGFRPLLQQYLQNIIYRDIVLRKRIKYQASLRELVNFLTANTAAVLSIEKIAQMIKVKNLMTVRNYLNHLTESFLFSLVPLYSSSIKKQIYNPDKIYLCDVGIYQELSFKFSQNKGKILENFVFNELKRKFSDIYYDKDPKDKEVDFIVKEKDKIHSLIQVCSDLSNQLTYQREIDNLLSAMKKYKKRQGLILTSDEGSEEVFPQGKVVVLPAWKFALDLYL